MLEALAIQHCPMSEWGGFMLEAMAIQHYPMFEWDGIMLEAMAIQHCPWPYVRIVNCVFCYSMRW